MRILILLLITMVSLVANSFYPKSTPLDGTWHYHINHEPQAVNYQYNFQGNEPTMTLPNNWYKEGVNHAGVMWFERTFKSVDLPKAKRHFIEFKGVDYLCDIWVNEHYIGSHKGYFQTFDFDITPYLKSGTNTIKVKVDSPLENYPEHYSLHKTLLRGIFAHHDTRPGGAWSAEGQDKNSGGIWNSVTIKSYQEHKLEALKVTPTVNEAQVNLDVTFSLQQLEQRLFSFGEKVEVMVTPANFEGESFKKSLNLRSMGIPAHEKEACESQRGQECPRYRVAMSLPNAKLWQTYDRGFPYLYNVSITIGDMKQIIQTGFKELKQLENEMHTLNGEVIYLKGTNYISSQYMSEMDEKALRKDLELMKAAHINTIRVHAHVEPHRFYQLCDEMGFLVWQDYNLQWGYSESEAFEAEALKQAYEMVDMLYNHPSIYIWSMHNEPPWNSDWMKWKYPDYNAEQNKRLDDMLYEKISSYDSYHLSKKLSSNLEHPWFGWYSGKYQDFVKPSKVPVITEYGAQAIPNKESLRKFVPDKYLHPKGAKAKKHWEYHNFQFNWSEKNGVKFKDTLSNFIHDSQTYQADLIKFATEMLRIQKYNGTTAIFQFMFNEGWPSMNWGVVDYYRQTKPGYEALKKAYAPIILVAKQREDNRIEFYVVNDEIKPITNAKLTIELSNGEKSTHTINTPKDSVYRLGNMKLSKAMGMKLSLKDENGKLITDNQYDFSPITKTKKEDKK
ncbi:MAG: glycoside hydrolase family 2 [Epsilonproteobacteria bacterium]|nr:glycoside hydrolase family 2 [Campylobacterota bacterium]